MAESADQSDLTALDIDAAPEDTYIRFKVCGRVVPGRGQISDPCLNDVRAADRERQGGRQ